MNGLQFCSVITLLIICIIIYVRLIAHSPLRRSGTVEATLDISEYGFGASKQLIILDITDIGDVENIDPSDKKYAKMSWSDINNQIEYNHIGIEFKGGISARQKLNYAIELWEDKDDLTCVSPETCDGTKEKLFGFSEKYEDYIIKHNEQDPAFISSILPFVTDGGIVEVTLVEVLIKIGDKMYYEGVYGFYSAIKRRLLEKRLNWEDDLGFEGKAEDCDDADYDIDHTAIIAEYTVPTDPTDRKKACPLFKDYNIKMKYPKCEDYDSTEFASCRQEYIDRTETAMSVLSWQNKTEVTLDLESFGKKYLLDLLLQKPDIGENSDYFTLTPDNKLYYGPRWDYDWTRFNTIFNQKSFNMPHVPFTEPLPLLKKLGKNKEFIDKVKSLTATVDTNGNVIDTLINERLEQNRDGYFDRNNERWDVLGKNFKPLTASWVLIGEESLTQNTMKGEINFWGNRLKARNNWVRDNLQTLESFRFYKPLSGYIVLAVLLYLTPITAASILIYYSFKEKNPYKIIN